MSRRGRPRARSGGGGPRALAPSNFATLRDWWVADNYSSGTGNLTSIGPGAHTLAQGNAAKRPVRNASSAAFGNRVTMTFDGVDDDLTVVAQCASARPYTFGIVVSCTSTTDAYVIGTNYTASYQFFRMNTTLDRVLTDPTGELYSAADVATPHLWLFSLTSDGTDNLTVYRDGVSLGVRTMAAGTGVPTQFYLGSAGGGNAAMEVGEAFTIDEAVSAGQAAALWRYYKARYAF